MPPRLVVVSGPSGVGKTTVCGHLLARAGFARVITATTRPPRSGERDGIDYLFLSERQFERWADAGKFLEWAEVYGKRYGSPRDQAEQILAGGRHALLNVDVQGAASIRAQGLPAVRVFLLPPSWEELERRLRSRGTDSEATIQARLVVARAELARQSEFDVRIENGDARKAADAIVAAVGSPA